MNTQNPIYGNDTALPKAKTGTRMKRRTVLAVFPGALASIAVPAVAANMSQPKPNCEILDLYANWCAANTEASFEGDLRGYGHQTAKEVAAERRAEKLRVKLVQSQPSTMPEVAALMHVLWSSLSYLPEDAENGVQFGAPILVAAIWRGASGQEGTPH